MKMLPSLPRVMLLIDADNVSADVIEQAVRLTMAEHGAIHVRRAYCNAETALKQQPLFKRLSVRPMVNLSAGKNSTDIALAVDAIDLAMAERPDIVVLVSSDSDFAPLVIRLREKGCRVCGIGQQGKTGDETVAVYDEFIDLQHHGARSVKQPVARPADAAPAPLPPAFAALAVPAAAAPVAKAAAKRAVRTPRGTAAAKNAGKNTSKTSPIPRVPPALPDEVLRILEAVPELGRGAKMELNQAVEGLRSVKLLAKSASSLKLFKKHPTLFALSPEKQPSKVQYIGPLPA
jgi:uncharacterized protein (TIGR00288 family)